MSRNSLGFVNFRRRREGSMLLIKLSGMLQFSYNAERINYSKHLVERFVLFTLFKIGNFLVSRRILKIDVTSKRGLTIFWELFTVISCMSKHFER